MCSRVATPADRVAIAALCRAAVLVQRSRQEDAVASLNWILTHDEQIVAERHTLPYAMFVCGAVVTVLRCRFATYLGAARALLVTSFR